MKVLFVNPGGHAAGGAERSLAGLIRGLTNRGHEAVVAVLAAGDAGAAFRATGAELLDCSDEPDLARASRHATSVGFLAGAARAAPAALRTARRLRRLIREEQPDVVHSNGFRAHVLTPLLHGPAPVVWSQRDATTSDLQRRLLQASATAAAAVLTNSAFTAAALGHVRTRVKVVGNPVVLGTLPARSTARFELSLPADRPVVAVAAHLHPSKGLHSAVEALQRWPERERPLLAIAGGNLYGAASDRCERDLQILAKDLGVADDIRLLGCVDPIETLYAAADIIVHPALHPEGFGRTVVEAQLAGVPIVATDLGSVRELVDHGRSGLLIPPGEPATLYGAVAKLLRDPAQSAKLVEAGRRAAAVHTLDRHAAAVEAVYQEILGARP